MNDKQRWLIRHICDGDIKRARQQAKIILNETTTSKDQQFKKTMLNLLDVKLNQLELPINIREFLTVENPSEFPESRFLLRPEEAKIVELVLKTSRAAEELTRMKIAYPPSLMLYGDSGCGKTMLARYIAHKLDRPFMYVRFSSIVDSYLGKTQSNISKVFNYVKTIPCVLCFDEIDAIGMARGQKEDVGEMSRIVVALMQELDTLPNSAIIIGATNRFNELDTALVRRFAIKHEILPMTRNDINALAERFFQYVEIPTEEWLSDWCNVNIAESEPASIIVEKCTRLLIEKIIKMKVKE